MNCLFFVMLRWHSSSSLAVVVSMSMLTTDITFSFSFSKSISSLFAKVLCWLRICSMLTKWNADPDLPDNDERSHLHWAAYKGYADCIRLLLFLDAYRGRQDKKGCTPLHWAAIKGNLDSCTVLGQALKKEDLTVTDNTGLTPAQLAADKGHKQVAFFLKM